MARTFNEIQTEIINKKNELIPELNSISKNSFWLRIVNVVAFAILTLETLFDIFKTDIQVLVENVRQGQIGYYVETSKEFQYPDVLNPLTNEYDVVNENLRIISRVSAREIILNERGAVRIKIAKNEPPEPLSSSEFNSFTSYIDQKKYAGVIINLINKPADVLVVVGTVWYDGEATEANALEAVLTQIEEFLSQKLKFDDLLYKNDLIAFIRESKLINNIKFTLITAQNSVLTNIDEVYESEAGYFILDKNASGFNFIAQ